MNDLTRDIRNIGTDPDALERFYLEHVDAVRLFIARRTSDAHRAADLTADVFVAAMSASAKYDSKYGEPSAWLIGIARNVCYKDARRRAREAKALNRFAGNRLTDEDAIGRAETILDSQRAARAVYEGIGKLPRAERAVFELVVVDGLSTDEAATALGVQPGTARVRLHRARRRLSTAPEITGCALPKET